MKKFAGEERHSPSMLHLARKLRMRYGPFIPVPGTVHPALGLSSPFRPAALTTDSSPPSPPPLPRPPPPPSADQLLRALKYEEALNFINAQGKTGHFSDFLRSYLVARLQSLAPGDASDSALLLDLLRRVNAYPDASLYERQAITRQLRALAADWGKGGGLELLRERLRPGSGAAAAAPRGAAAAAAAAAGSDAAPQPGRGNQVASGASGVSEANKGEERGGSALPLITPEEDASRQLATLGLDELSPAQAPRPRPGPQHIEPGSPLESDRIASAAGTAAAGDAPATAGSAAGAASPLAESVASLSSVDEVSIPGGEVSVPTTPPPAKGRRKAPRGAGPVVAMRTMEEVQSCGPFMTVFFDLETSDKYPGNRFIAQIAAYVADTNQWFMEYVRLPRGRTMSPGASRVNGITDQMLSDKDTFAQVAPRFLRFLEANRAALAARGGAGAEAGATSAATLPRLLFVAYNGISFDVPIIVDEFKDAGVSLPDGTMQLDTYILAQLCKEMKYIGGTALRLGEIASELGISLQGTAHEAAYDVKLLTEVHSQLIQRLMRPQPAGPGLTFKEVNGLFADTLETAASLQYSRRVVDVYSKRLMCFLEAKNGTAPLPPPPPPPQPSPTHFEYDTATPSSAAGAADMASSHWASLARADRAQAQAAQAAPQQEPPSLDSQATQATEAPAMDQPGPALSDHPDLDVPAAGAAPAAPPPLPAASRPPPPELPSTAEVQAVLERWARGAGAEGAEGVASTSGRKRRGSRKGEDSGAPGPAERLATLSGRLLGELEEGTARVEGSIPDVGQLVHGNGLRKAEALKLRAAALSSSDDLLWRLPREHTCYSPLARAGHPWVFRGTVQGTSTWSGGGAAGLYVRVGGRSPVVVEGGGVEEVEVLASASYVMKGRGKYVVARLKDEYRAGDVVQLVGTVDKGFHAVPGERGGRIAIRVNSPDSLDILPPASLSLPLRPLFVPKYAASGDCDPNLIKKAVRAAIQHSLPSLLIPPADTRDQATHPGRSSDRGPGQASPAAAAVAAAAPWPAEEEEEGGEMGPLSSDAAEQHALLFGSVEEFTWAGQGDGEGEGEGEAEEPGEIGAASPREGKGSAAQSEGWPDPMPPHLTAPLGLPPTPLAVRYAHLPSAAYDLHDAMERRAFDLAVAQQLALLVRRGAVMAAYRGEAALSDPAAPRAGGDASPAPLLSAARAALGFRMTDSQEAALSDILGDMGKAYPMQRIIQGDVGSGKTAVAFLAMVAAADAGRQAALMAPTEVLAEQHYLRLRELMERAELPEGTTRPAPLLLTSSLTAPKRRAALKALAAGEARLVVGTHALIAADVSLPQLGLAIIDEEHKFGVEQRRALLAKAKAGEGGGNGTPSLLSMSATPIPRSLALSVFGGAPVSTLYPLPGVEGGGRRVATRVCTEGDKSDMAAAYGRIRSEVEAGRRAYIVYPLISEAGPPGAADWGSAEDAEADPFVKAAEDEFKRIVAERRCGPSARVAILHGRIPPAARNETMRAFAEGHVDVLVATSLVEVGLDVRQASVIVVHGADRFGLAQLHQLRGRVGRGDEGGWCFLFAPPAAPAVLGEATEDLGAPAGKSGATGKGSKGGKGKAAATASSEEGNGPAAAAFPPSLSQARLRVLESETDGFAIAEADLRLRGPGEVLGTRQSGLGGAEAAELVGLLGALGGERAAAVLCGANRVAVDLLSRSPPQSLSALPPGVMRLVYKVGGGYLRDMQPLD